MSSEADWHAVCNEEPGCGDQEVICLGFPVRSNACVPRSTEPNLAWNRGDSFHSYSDVPRRKYVLRNRVWKEHSCFRYWWQNCVHVPHILQYSGDLPPCTGGGWGKGWAKELLGEFQCHRRKDGQDSIRTHTEQSWWNAEREEETEGTEQLGTETGGWWSRGRGRWNRLSEAARFYGGLAQRQPFWDRFHAGSSESQAMWIVHGAVPQRRCDLRSTRHSCWAHGAVFVPQKGCKWQFHAYGADLEERNTKVLLCQEASNGVLRRSLAHGAGIHDKQRDEHPCRLVCVELPICKRNQNPSHVHRSFNLYL